MTDNQAEENAEGCAVTQSEQAWMARMQYRFAAVGEAMNQCQDCGAYRADGRPPLVHQPGCVR